MIGGGTTYGRAVALAAALLALGGPLRAQAAPDYRAASPRDLVRELKSAPPEDRAAIVSAMVARRGQVLPELWNSARFGDAADKVIACSMIAELRDRDGVDAVIDASSDGDVRVRRRAATTLRILNDRRAAARLRHLVRTDPDLGVVKSSVVALAQLGAPRDVALIAPLLGHADPEVRVVAAGALAMLGDERGLALVLQATRRADDPGAQNSATYALGFFADAAAAARLQEILADPQGAWRGYALTAVAQRQLAGQPPAAQIATLEALATGRSRTAAEWSVERLTDLGGPDAAAVLRKVRSKSTPVSRLAERRLQLLEAQP
ncbi:MAG: HEAT repeat domain-containing protein [Deltaproteobacteria bacterium]|nr:HEAT repeat domain-containing protein [Deltaproteobacteria bacterium]